MYSFYFPTDRSDWQSKMQCVAGRVWRLYCDEWDGSCRPVEIFGADDCVPLPRLADVYGRPFCANTIQQPPGTLLFDRWQNSLICDGPPTSHFVVHMDST